MAGSRSLKKDVQRSKSSAIVSSNGGPMAWAERFTLGLPRRFAPKGLYCELADYVAALRAMSRQHWPIPLQKICCKWRQCTDGAFRPGFRRASMRLQHDRVDGLAGAYGDERGAWQAHQVVAPRKTLIVLLRSISTTVRKAFADMPSAGARKVPGRTDTTISSGPNVSTTSSMTPRVLP